MTSFKIGEDLRALAKEARRRDQGLIMERLAAGEEIGLGEAVAVFGILPRDSWRLGAFGGRGRYGGPFEPHVTIPAFAWNCVRWETDGVEIALVTPEGAKVYDVWLSSAEGASVEVASEKPPAQSKLEAGRETAADETPEPASFEEPGTTGDDPTEVFLCIVEGDRPEGCSWTMAEYAAALAPAGLSLTPNKGVSGVRLVAQGQVERWRTSTLLRTILLISRFRAGGASLHSRFKMSRRGTAKHLYLWLLENHGHVIPPETARHIREGSEQADDLADRLVEKLKRHFPDL